MSDDKDTDLRVVCYLERTNHSWESKPSLEFTACVQQIRDRELVGFSSYYSNEGYQGLQIHTWSHPEDEAPSFHTSCLRPCWRDLYHVELPQLEQMVKTGRAVEKKLREMELRLGYAVDIAAYLARFAIAVRADKDCPFLRRVEADTDAIWSPVDGYVPMSALQLGWWIKDRLTKFDEARAGS